MDTRTVHAMDGFERSRDRLTPEQWEALRGSVDPLYRDAWQLCDKCDRMGLSIDDPLYHFAGKLLRAAIDLRQVAEKALAGDPEPAVESPRSMLYWVMPHTGGGQVPGKRGYEAGGR